MRCAAGLIAVLLGGAPAIAQGTAKYWPQLDIGLPVPKAVLEQTPRPVKLRLYSATPNGKFTLASELAADRLAPIPNRQPGFEYKARGDGEEEFAVQLVYADGGVSVNTDQLRPEFRVIFDTRPPVITLSPAGGYGVDWTVQDDNLDSGSVKLECRWLNGDSKWHEVKARSFNAKDGYTWTSLGRESRILEVRLSARDKAGHEAVSRVVKLPANAESAMRSGVDTDVRPTGARMLPEESSNQPQIVYVNKRDLKIRTKLTHVTRSGVAKVHLYFKDLSAANGEWKFDKTQTCDIKSDSADTTVEIPFLAPKDGRYGFIVIPESGVERRDPEPRPGAAPQHLVEVITALPAVKIRNVTVSPGGAIGPRVEIEWDADGRNLLPDPIVLEYAAAPTSPTWLSIAEKIPNSRRFVWEVSEKTLFKIYIRARATDKATNTGEHIYDKPVIIDLDKPSATIENVRGSGSAFPSSSDRFPSTAPSKLPEAGPVTPIPSTGGMLLPIPGGK